MARPDDSSLEPEQLSAVRRAGLEILNKAEAWDRFPTPVDEIMQAAKLEVAPLSVFDPRSIERYAKQVGQAASRFLRTAIEKVMGVLDLNAGTVHIDDAVGDSKQRFLKLHEAGHNEIPHQRSMFRFVQDCKQTLAPDTADLFEREANNFARMVLFQDDRFAVMAADHEFSIKVPLKLQRKFGSSAYAAMREYVRNHSKVCAVIVLEPPCLKEWTGFEAEVRRIEHSPSFVSQFGRLQLAALIDSDSPLAPFVPLNGKRMAAPNTLPLADKNGEIHEFIGEGFATPFNVFVLIHASETLARSSLVLPNN